MRLLGRSCGEPWEWKRGKGGWGRSLSESVVGCMPDHTDQWWTIKIGAGVAVVWALCMGSAEAPQLASG